MMPESILRKWMPVARPIGEFRNGDQPGILDERVIADLIRNFERNTEIPIFLWEHVEDLDAKPPDGWVEDMRVRPDGLLEILAKLHGEAADLVSGDRIRRASIAWRPEARGYQGEPLGAMLMHVTLTNNPYIKDLPNIAAARTQGGESLLHCFIALPVEDAGMADEPGTKKDEGGPAGSKAEADQQALLKLQEQEKTIVELKAETLRKGEEIETLRTQLANAKADVDKEAALVEVVNLKRKDFLRDVRALVEYGLNKGTLLAAECEGYAGTSPRDLSATERWFKASKFYDATAPDPEGRAFAVLEHIATKTVPRVNIGARFQSGAPKGSPETLTLSQEQKDGIRKLGLNPEMVAAMKDDTTFEERMRLKADLKGAN